MNNTMPKPQTAFVCRHCQSTTLDTVVDLGDSPPANALFPSQAQATGQRRYPLHVVKCRACHLVQLDYQVPPEALFSDYAYFSSYSSSWVAHAKRYVDETVKRLALSPDALAIEIASNDGYLLQHFLPHNVPVLGIEPAANIAAIAETKHIPTRVEFFTTAYAKQLQQEGIAADVIIANNVLAHVPDIHDFLGGIPYILKDTGVMTIEVPHLLSLIDGLQFDTIYHEHVFYFSLYALEAIMSECRLKVIDVETIPTHGGSLRLWITHADSSHHTITPAVGALREREASAGVADSVLYQRYAEQVEACKQAFCGFLSKAKAEGRRVVGYGAAAKSTVLLNYAQVDSKDIAYVVDKSPHKQGNYIPGCGIPIVAKEQLQTDKPDDIIIFPWNIKEEIAQELAFTQAWGCRLWVAIPRMQKVA